MSDLNTDKPNFTTKLLLFFIALNIITTTDAGFNAPLIVKMTSVFSVDVIAVSFYLSLLTTIPALLIPIFGIISDKFKRVPIVFIVVLCGAIVSVFMVLIILFAQNFVLFALFGILAGTINIALGPTLFSLIVDYVPAKNRAGVMGWMGIAGTTAIALGFIVSGIIPVSIFGPDFPLWFPYAFDAVSGFLFAGLTLFIKEPPRGVQEEGLSELYAKGESYSSTLTFKGAKDFVKSPINQRLILFNIFSKILSGMLGTYFITFLIINHGFNEATATYVMFAIFGIQLFGQIFWGNKGDKAFQIEKDGHLKIMIRTTLMALFFVTWVFLIPFNFETQAGFYLFLLFAIILAIGSFFGVGSIPSFGAVIAAVNPPEIRGTANSINFLITTIVKSVMLIVFALLATNFLHNNYSLAFSFFALSYIPAVLVILTMRKLIIPSIDKVQEKLKAGI